MSGSGIILSGGGVLSGFLVNSTSSGTLKIVEGTVGGGTLIFNTITAPASGTFVNLNNVLINGNGCFGQWVAGTLDVTFTLKERD
jgi:hypothetical protein